jgi:glycosyltransferase involved in cell wall biosynthesis
MTGPPRPVADDRPAVLAWRDYWLAPSETFIRDQVSCLTRWRAVCVGRRRYDDPLVTPVFAPHSDALLARVASRLPAAPHARRRYQQIFADPAVKLVHAHFGPDAVSALPYAIRAGKPLVVSFYAMDVTSLPYRRSLAARRYRAQLPELFRRAHTLISPSQYLAEQLEALGAPIDKIIINSPGTLVRPHAAARPDRSGVIFVGRLVPKKGVADLLAAMAMLPEPLRSARVTIAGYGPLRAELTAMADRLALNASFIGRQSSDTIAGLLAEHAVFCGPSRRAPDGDAESLGMVFIEAALAGLPVVAYRHGGVPEAVADRLTGLLAPEGDIARLSSDLGALLADPALAAGMGTAGYLRAAALFDLTTQNSRLEEIYDAVAEPVATSAAHRSGTPYRTDAGSRSLGRYSP